MKIGILTFHWANNYGAVIQTFALLSKLKELGHEAYIIDRQMVYKGILRKLYHKLSYEHFFSWRKFREDADAFLQPKTKTYTSHDELVKNFDEENFDAVIVGSDQVWRWKLIGLNYFLDFITNDNIKRYSYAASFGLDEWHGSEEDRIEISALLKKFNKVSVREETGVNICKNTFGVDAELVLDPTLLHTRDFYERTLLKNHRAHSSGKVVSYILGENKKLVIGIAEWAKSIGRKHNELFSTAIDYPVLMGKSERHITHVTPIEWMNEIRNAEYVVTNSFHAAVFSILFQKQFVVLTHDGGGNNRLETLFNTLGIKGRSMNDIASISTILSDEIDYGIVNKKLEESRMSSEAFLKNIQLWQQL